MRLRAAVLGANDGLCSNLSLVMGVAGASISRHGILITGVAGLIAGAFSMALGEWVSVTSARELAEREIRIESSELQEDPKGEGEELQLIYESKGLSGDEAKRVVDQMLSDKTATLDALAREELGIDPTELGGSAYEAALASFMLFALGAIVPILPFLGHRREVSRLSKRRTQRSRLVRDWRRDHDLYRGDRLALREPTTRARSGSCGRNLRYWTAYRRHSDLRRPDKPRRHRTNRGKRGLGGSRRWNSRCSRAVTVCSKRRVSMTWVASTSPTFPTAVSTGAIPAATSKR